MEDFKNEIFHPTKPLPSGFKKRKRQRTPPEEIYSADEAEYIVAEDAADRRRSDEDANFDGVAENDGTIRRSERIAQQ